MAGLVLSLGAALALFSQNTEAPYPPAQGEAPAAFDGQTNGLVDQPTHAADQVKFDEIDQISDGLGPLYNAQSCRECHQNPTSGGGSQTAELRAAVPDAKLRGLTAASGGWILVALAARLGIVKRAQPVADLVDFVKFYLVGRMGRLIHQPVRLSVKRRGGFALCRRVRGFGILREQRERCAKT